VRGNRQVVGFWDVQLLPQGSLQIGKKEMIERKGENGKAQVGRRLLGCSAPSSGLPANRQKRKRLKEKGRMVKHR